MKKIERAEMNQQTLSEIIHWKFPRRRDHLVPLKALEKDRLTETLRIIGDVTDLVSDTLDKGPLDEVTPIVKLDNIYGWGVPMASAFLTVEYPELFTVADGLVVVRCCGE